MPRVEREENARLAHDLRQSENGDRREPNRHDRTEHRAHAPRSELLEHEKPAQDRDRNWNDEMLERRRRDRHTFDGAEHRDRRRDDPVAVQECSAEETEDDQDPAALHVGLSALLLENERHQRENAALAAVVRTHDEDDVLHRDDEHEHPHDERQHAEDVLGRGRQREFFRGEALLQRVERARADVAVDDAERSQREEREALTGGMFFDVLSLWDRRMKTAGGGSGRRQNVGSRLAGRRLRPFWRRFFRGFGAARLRSHVETAGPSRLEHKMSGAMNDAPPRTQKWVAAVRPRPILKFSVSTEGVQRPSAEFSTTS